MLGARLTDVYTLVYTYSFVQRTFVVSAQDVTGEISVHAKPSIVFVALAGVHNFNPAVWGLHLILLNLGFR